MANKTNKIRIGVDLGGTNLVAGIVNDNREITSKASIPTKIGESYKVIMKDMAELIKKLVEDSGYQLSDIESVGIGSPGAIDNKNGVVYSASNLKFENAPVVEEFRKYINVPVNLENDANAAAYGEYKTTGDNCESFVLVTFGTGVGGGIVINGKIYRGFNGIGGEIGHVLLKQDGIPCPCGRTGCWEAYASATALIKQTKEAIKNHPESIMAKVEKVNGTTAFEAEKLGDEAAKEVVANYISYVSEGIIDIITLLQPNKILIGGGISNEGENLLNKINAYISAHLKTYGVPQPEISIATLRNDAGIIGAAFAASDM